MNSKRITKRQVIYKMDTQETVYIHKFYNRVSDPEGKNERICVENYSSNFKNTSG